MKKATKPEDHYAITVAYSAEDEGFVARAPAFPTAVCVMDTPERALTEMRMILGMFIESMAERKVSVPEPDAAILDDVRRLLPIINLSKLSREAGINRNTMEARLRRGTPMPKRDAAKVRRALERLAVA